MGRRAKASHAFGTLTISRRVGRTFHVAGLPAAQSAQAGDRRHPRRHRRDLHRELERDPPAWLHPAAWRRSATSPAPPSGRNPDRDSSSPTCPASRLAERPWSAAPKDELEQWRAFDRSGRPEDEPYYRTGLSTFGQPPETARKAGKTGSLAFQYQGGIGAYRRVTGDLTLPEETVAARRDAWRADHPSYVTFWRLSVFQAVQAIRNPGMEFTANVITFKYDRAHRLSGAAAAVRALPHLSESRANRGRTVRHHELHVSRRQRQQKRSHVPRTPRQRCLRRAHARELLPGNLPGYLRRGYAAPGGRRLSDSSCTPTMNSSAKCPTVSARSRNSSPSSPNPRAGRRICRSPPRPVSPIG